MATTTRRHQSRRNPYRPGTVSYDRQRRAELRRKEALAKANAARAKSAETRRRGRQQAAQAQRAVKQIDARELYRNTLSEADRAAFNALSIKEQQQRVTGGTGGGIGPTSIKDRFKRRLFGLYPNARNFPRAFDDIDTYSDDFIRQLDQLSGDDLATLIRHRDYGSLHDILSELIGEEPAEYPSVNPLHYHRHRTIMGVI